MTRSIVAAIACATAAILIGFAMGNAYQCASAPDGICPAAQLAHEQRDALGYQLMACEDALGEAWEMAETNGVAAPAWVAAEVTR